MNRYTEIAKKIFDNIGGKDNISNINHCATRLRVKVIDVNKINDDIISKIDGVTGTVKRDQEYQIVIGTDVENVYNEFKKVSDIDEENVTLASSGMKFSLKHVGNIAIDFVSGTFVPILGVLVAAGLVSAILNIGTAFFNLSTKSGTYTVLYAIYQAGYFFLPMFLGYSSAKKLNMNPMMGGFLGAVLVYNTIDGAKGLSFLGLNIPTIQYNTSVIPILLGILFMKLVDNILGKVTPKSISFFVKPLLTMLVVVPITLLYLGPLGYEVGSVIADMLSFINIKLGWISVGLIAALTPILVMTGTNQALFPICIAAVANTGYDSFILPGMLAANVAVGASALAVATYSNDSRERQLGISAGITGVMGITEPAIFGILLNNRIALLSTILSAGITGIIAGLLSLKQFAIVSPGIAALPTFIHTKNGHLDSNIYIAIGVLVLSFCISYGVTSFLGRKMQSSRRNITNVSVYSPVEGKAIPLSNVKDEVFSKGLVGVGIAIEPSNGKIYSPVTGKVKMISESKHALGIEMKDGTEILIHLGIDTVGLNGLPFDIKVSNGQSVEQGILLATMNLEMIKKFGKDTTIIIVSTQKNKGIIDEKYGFTNSGEVLFNLSAK